MGRTLYLNENSNINVMRDGPSVWIQWRGGSGQRVPARLVGRVIVIGNVRLEAGVITLFTENDVPMLFLNRATDEAALAVPYNHKLPKHYEEQKVFLETPKTVERYKYWADVKRMNIQVKMLMRLKHPIASKISHGFGEGNYQEILRTMRYCSVDKWNAAISIISNLFRLLITEHLIKADLDYHMGIIHRRHNFGLALDMCYIMGGEIDAQAVQFFRTGRDKDFIERSGNNWIVTDSGMKDIIHRFENRKDALSVIIEDIIDELFELIREIRSRAAV